MNIKCIFGHKWVYWLGEWFEGRITAWNRGCLRCRKHEIAVKSGNSFLYSEGYAKSLMDFETQESYDKRVKKERELIKSFQK